MDLVDSFSVTAGTTHTDGEAGGRSLRPRRCLLFQRWRSEAHSPPRYLNGCLRFLEAPGENQAPPPALSVCTICRLQQTDRGRIPSGREVVLPVRQQQGKTCSFQNITMSFELPALMVRESCGNHCSFLGTRPGHAQGRAVFIFPASHFFFGVPLRSLSLEMSNLASAYDEDN